VLEQGTSATRALLGIAAYAVTTLEVPAGLCFPPY